MLLGRLPRYEVRFMLPGNLLAINFMLRKRLSRPPVMPS